MNTTPQTLDQQRARILELENALLQAHGFLIALRDMWVMRVWGLAPRITDFAQRMERIIGNRLQGGGYRA